MKLKVVVKRNLPLLRLALAGVAAATAASSLRADTTVVFAGGNASSSVLYDRASNVLSGLTVTVASSTLQTFTGTIPGQSGLGNVTIHFVLSGAVGGLQSVANQANVTTATGASLAPQVAVSSTSPSAVGVDPSVFTSAQTLVVPYAFIKNPASSALAGVTNLTQRQAAYLESAAGTLPVSYFGGTGTNLIYLVGRNTASAVRTEIDANVYFTGTLATYTTNSSLQPIPDTSANPGQSSGAAIRSLLGVITNAIGTVAASDIKTFTPLAYEGVPYSVANVENGSYPLWGYEAWYQLSAGSQGAPSANQTAVINALFSAVTSATYQTTSPVFVGNFAPLSGLQVYRSADGGPIQSLLY